MVGSSFLHISSLITMTNSDYNYVLQNGKCVAAGPEPIGPGICKGESPNEKYLGSSGYRLIPGNTCTKDGGLVLDNPLEKDCSQGKSGSQVASLM